MQEHWYKQRHEGINLVEQGPDEQILVITPERELAGVHFARLDKKSLVIGVSTHRDRYWVHRLAGALVANDIPFALSPAVKEGTQRRVCFTIDHNEEAVKAGWKKVVSHLDYHERFPEPARKP